MKRIPWVTLTVAAAALVAWRSGAPAYDRAAIAHGELWRLITGHLAHWSAEHLLWDVLVFVALGAFCECERGHRSLAGVVFASALTVSAFLFLGCPDVGEYRGLSAIDSTLWCWAAMIIAPRSRSLATLLVAVFAGKLMLEVASNAALFVPLAGSVRVLPIVHFAGAIVGFSAAVAGHFFRGAETASNSWASRAGSTASGGASTGTSCSGETSGEPRA